MKLKSVSVGQLRIGSIIREPIGQTLYHRVKGIQREEGVGVTIFFDGGVGLAVALDDHLYVLEDEPAPIVLDGMTLA